MQNNNKNMIFISALFFLFFISISLTLWMTNKKESYVSISSNAEPYMIARSALPWGVQLKVDYIKDGVDKIVYKAKEGIFNPYEEKGISLLEVKEIETTDDEIVYWNVPAKLNEFDDNSVLNNWTDGIVDQITIEVYKDNTIVELRTIDIKQLENGGVFEAIGCDKYDL